MTRLPTLCAQRGAGWRDSGHRNLSVTTLIMLSPIGCKACCAGTGVETVIIFQQTNNHP